MIKQWIVPFWSSVGRTTFHFSGFHQVGLLQCPQDASQCLIFFGWILHCIVRYGMDIEHTFVNVLAYSRSSSGSVCAPYSYSKSYSYSNSCSYMYSNTMILKRASSKLNVNKGVFNAHAILYNKINLKI